MSNNSETFCYNAFTGLDISPAGRIRPCCKFDLKLIPNFNIADGIEKYRNSNWLKQLQYDFVKGKRPSGCSRCWQEEDAGIESRRQHDYKRFKSQLDLLSLREKEFTIVGVAFNNLCNLACRICGPWASSSWVTEYKKHNPTLNAQIYNWSKLASNVDDLYNFSRNAVLLEIVGGEPFLSDFNEHIEFLKKFVTDGTAQNVTIHYSTNGSVFPDDRYIELWKNFKEIDIQLSLDDIEQRFEYNRWPAKWDHVYTNINLYKQLKNSENNIKLSIAFTVSAFTIFYADDFVKWCIKEELPDPWLGLVSIHPYYLPSSLPKNIKDKTRTKLLNSEFENVRKLSKYLDSDGDLSENFIEMVDRVDVQRSQNFYITFSEMVSE